MDWVWLKTKYEPTSVTFLVKIEKIFRKIRLKKNKEPDSWIANLEELRMK
jgi:hypothetical protein